MAWKSFRIGLSEFSQNEDVYSDRSGANEPWNYTELLQCKVFWQLTGYKVPSHLLAKRKMNKVAIDGKVVVNSGFDFAIPFPSLGTSLSPR